VLARTSVFTAASNFDWDDQFDVELYLLRKISFCVFTWDGYGNHRACFAAPVNLTDLFQGGTRHHRLAIELKPSGMLYAELAYRDPASVFQRTPSVHTNALYGTDLASIVRREDTGGNVPILLLRCIMEVDRRGIDQTGIYRLRGSSNNVRNLRDALEKDLHSVDLWTWCGNDINVITGKIVFLNIAIEFFLWKRLASLSASTLNITRTPFIINHIQFLKLRQC